MINSFLYKNKLKLLVGLVVILLSILAVSSVISQRASAVTGPGGGGTDTNNPDDWTPELRAERWTYLPALALCFGEDMHDGTLHDRINDSNAKSGDWMRESTAGIDHERAGGWISLKPGDNGKSQCNDIVKATVEIYKFSDPLDLLCQLGADRKDGDSCESGTSDFKALGPYRNGLGVALKNKAWGAHEYKNSAAGYYALHRAAFHGFCNPTESTTATADFKYVVKEVSAEGVVTEVTYEGLKHDKKTYAYTAANLHEQEKTCEDIANEMNNLAGDYAQWIILHPDGGIDGTPGSTDSTSGGDNTTTCAVDGIGWIVCPVMNIMASLNKAAYEFLAGTFLQIEPELLTGNGSPNSDGTRVAWQSFRDIANVAFVLAFLVVIYGQITGGGITNYGIKKLLPRIIIAAILVNVSYYICQIAVDISNILGSSMMSLFNSIPVGDAGSDPSAIGSGWTDVASGTLKIAGTAVGIIALLALVILAPASLLAFAVIVLILIARKAFIILLIVISPLAFVAYLLPNTEQWFKKWWKALTTLLLVFPIIGIVFGASTLASSILMVVAGDDGQMMAIVALGVQAIPLFAVPVLLKGALSAAGSVGQRLSGYADKAQGRAGKQAKAGYEKSVAGQYMKYRQNEGNKRRASIQAGAYTGAGGRLNPRNWRSQAMKRVNSADLPGSLGKFGDRLAAGGAKLADKDWDETVGDQQTMMSHAGLSPDELHAIVMDDKHSDEYRAAAAGMIMKNGAMKDIHRLTEATQGMGNTDTASSVRKQMMHDMNRTPFGMGAGDIALMKRGKRMTTDSKDDGPVKKSYQQMLNSRAEGKLSAGTWAGLDPDDQIALAGFASTPGALSDTAMQSLVDATAEAESNPNIDVKVEARRHGATIRESAAARGIVPSAGSAPQTSSSDSGGPGSFSGGPNGLT